MSIGDIAKMGLQASMTDMGAISNNIANVNTMGYKKSHANFSDVYARSMQGVTQLGCGVKTSRIAQDFSAGRLELTERSLDLSIANDGFFIQKDMPNGQINYTRAGRFDVDKDGYFVGANGRLQGYPATNGKISGSGALVDLQLAQGTIPAKPTSLVSVGLNLNAEATVPTVVPFKASDPGSYNYRSDMTVFDSLGQSYPLSLFYIKETDNQWVAQVLVNHENIGQGTVSFDSTGALARTTNLDALSWTPSGGATAKQPFSLQLTGTTQFAGDYKSYKTDQDGYQSGAPTGFHIDDSGKVNVYYSNGQSQVEGQVALARFRSTQGLSRGENMSWVATPQSGEALISPSTSEGAINSGMLEYSNVDLTDELVKLMGAQHNFQANAQVAQTYNQMMQTIENI